MGQPYICAECDELYNAKDHPPTEWAGHHNDLVCPECWTELEGERRVDMRETYEHLPEEPTR
jgi:hypothetical protein